MAKVAFSKLKCKINTTELPVTIGEETIMVKTYLPIQEKLELISMVLSMSHDPETNYENPVLNEILTDLNLVFYYTNLSFTDKQKEDLPKLYDQLVSSGALEMILNTIPEAEKIMIKNAAKVTSKAIYNYRQSLLGILEIAKEEYSETDFNMEEILKGLKSDDVGLLKDIISRLG